MLLACHTRTIMIVVKGAIATELGGGNYLLFWHGKEVRGRVHSLSVEELAQGGGYCLLLRAR